MDYFFRSLILFFVCGSAFAVPKFPTFGIVRAGPVTTYTVGPSTYSPLVKAPTGTGLKVLDGNYSAAPAGYITQASILVGETIAAVNVTSPVSAASIAAAAVGFISNPYLAAAVVIGSALYNYFDSSGLAPVPGGGLGTVLPLTSSPLGTWCNNTGFICAPTQSQLCDLLSVGNTIQGDIRSVSDSTHCGNTHYYPGYPSTYNPTSDTVHFTSNGTCSSGYAYSSGSCNRVGSPSPVPVSSQTATTSLTSHPPSSLSDVIGEIHTADPSGVHDPLSDSTPTITLDTSPILGAPKTTVMPDGKTQVSTDTTTLIQPTPQSFTATTNTTTVTTNPDNTTITTNIANAPPAPPPEPKTDCDKFPDNIGCSKFGNPTPIEIIPVENIPLSNAYSSWGSGSCPSAVSLPHGITFKYDSMCSALVILKPILIAMGLLISMFIVSGGVKE